MPVRHFLGSLLLLTTLVGPAFADDAPSSEPSSDEHAELHWPPATKGRAFGFGALGGAAGLTAGVGVSLALFAYVDLPTGQGCVEYCGTTLSNATLVGIPISGLVMGAATGASLGGEYRFVPTLGGALAGGVVALPVAYYLGYQTGSLAAMAVPIIAMPALGGMWTGWLMSRTKSRSMARRRVLVVPNVSKREPGLVLTGRF